MEFGPIWRSLKRNKAGYILIATQIAVTMAIMISPFFTHLAFA